MLNANGDKQPIDVSIESIYLELKKMDPNGVDFSMGGFRTFLAKWNLISDPMKKWLVKYVSISTVIEEMTKGMEGAVKEMERDNETLLHDQIAMKELTFKLEDVVKWAMFVDKQIVDKLTADITATKKKFIEEDILFGLRQKIAALQELQGINRQGVLVSEVIIKGNKELIRGYKNGLQTTIAAIGIASALTVSLEKQRRNQRVLTGVNDLKGELIRKSGEMLKDNVENIIAESKTAGTRIDALKAGFTAALESNEMMSNFKVEYLPILSEKIDELSTVNAQLSKAIEGFAVQQPEESHSNVTDGMLPL